MEKYKVDKWEEIENGKDGVYLFNSNRGYEIWFVKEGDNICVAMEEGLDNKYGFWNLVYNHYFGEDKKEVKEFNIKEDYIKHVEEENYHLRQILKRLL